MTILLLLLFVNGFSQKVISGIILSADNGNAIIGASVFISNTSTGTVTGNNGEFVLKGVPDGRHELVISSVGYETFARSFSTEELPLNLNIKLKLKIKELEGVTVIPFEKDGWQKWGRVFIENFIGTDENAAICEIKNYDAIRFRFSKTDNKLTAIAIEPLQISNYALGYKINYQLENFEIDFKNNRMTSWGYAFFKEMEGSKKKWIRERISAYSGSMLHFMRSICGNVLMEEGFQVRRMKKVGNVEKVRVKEIYKAVPKRRIDDQTGRVTTVMDYNRELLPKDTVAYYEKVLKQEDTLDVYGSSLLTADSIAGIDSNRAIYMVFPDYLSVVYTNGKVEKNYFLRNMQFNKGFSTPHSYLRLIGRGYITIKGLGNYYNPLDLLSTGYWAWKERLSSLLPYDYKPPQ
jgi:hypothetical protein